MKVSSDWRVTIPKAVRDELGIMPGDGIEFVKDNGTYRIRKHFNEAKFNATIEKWAGALGPLPKGKTVDDIIDDMRGW